jgi:hypothetical protein
VSREVIQSVLSSPGRSDSYKSVAVWMYYGTNACFLQDADNLAMKTQELVDVLTFLKEKFPEITRITTYTRSRTVARKTVESLTQIRKAGLDRIHIGLETGCDPLLELMKKGVTRAQHIEAGRRAVRAGMELSEYVMPGLGGQEMWQEHARETADALNEINPHFIRLRSLRVPPRVPLHKKLEDGSFTMQTDDGLAEEIKLFINTLDGITSTVASDHIMNLLEEVSGELPKDKEKMLDVIRGYQELSAEDRLIYRVGRRGGMYHSTEDLDRDPVTYQKIRAMISRVREKDGEPGVEKLITELVDRYI